MAKKKLKLYLFSGKTVLVANRIKVLQNKLPNAVDITRRMLLLQEMNQTTFDPFILELNVEETELFYNEIKSKLVSSSPPDPFIYLTSDWSKRKSIENPGIVKIKLANQ